MAMITPRTAATMPRPGSASAVLVRRAFTFFFVGGYVFFH
jgi:hypothetical protein